MNEAKTVWASKAGRRTVTGIVLTPDGKLSVGRERKRLIRAMYDRHTKGLLSDEESQKLKGLIAFVSSIEADFVARLQRNVGGNGG